MLRKVSATEPVLGVVGTICVTTENVAPSEEAAPETLELPEVDAPGPRPPVVVIDDGNDNDTFIGGGFSNPPVCPVPERKTTFDPLTGQTITFYTYGPGVTVIPPECGSGFRP